MYRSSFDESRFRLGKTNNETSNKKVELAGFGIRLFYFVIPTDKDSN